MPIYEYVCSSCNSKFELLRPASKAQEGASCPECQSIAERILSAFCAVSKDGSGATVPVGGSSCAGCSSTACSSCRL